jgi:VIT1/CCC1 family predicted Fe2+/Mn2+ transporter
MPRLLPPDLSDRYRVLLAHYRATAEHRSMRSAVGRGHLLRREPLDMPRLRHHEVHHSGRASWLRAAVLGSNDAIVSMASLMIGVAASAASDRAVLVAGVAGLVAGAMSMAVGEYVSVSSQRDAERADVEREKQELAANPPSELNELASIYEKRGVDKELARRVAEQLSAHDALAAHLRDELGIHADSVPRPLQAAWISALSFSVMGSIPIVTLLVVPTAWRGRAMASAALASLALLGALGGRLGGAPIGRAALRVTLGGGVAMAITAGIGQLFNALSN